MFLTIVLALFAVTRRVSAVPVENKSKTYMKGDEVKLYVNSLSSTKTLFPIDRYHLPFCQPVEGVHLSNQNLGQFLKGDRITNSPYNTYMKIEVYCAQLCLTNFGRAEYKGLKPNKMVQAIRSKYHENWILDNLPAASRLEDDRHIITRFWQGNPLGFIDHSGRAFIHNHANIIVNYEEVASGKYRVLRFTVEPFSIKHDFQYTDDGRVLFINPISSCKEKSQRHTAYEMITAMGRQPQPASGQVLFTYDVIWEKPYQDDLSWSTRWDIYITMDNAVPDRVHTFSLMNSLIAFLIIIAFSLVVFIRDARSHHENEEGNGWRALHADVFRAPSSPTLLAVACGTGAQLATTLFACTFIAWMGYWNAAHRGRFLMGILVTYGSAGVVGGYVAARFHKTFRRSAWDLEWQRVMFWTSNGLVGVIFVIFLIFQGVALMNHSTLAVPFATIFCLLLLWGLFSTPMVYLGALIGYRQDVFCFPVETSSTCRPIPVPRKKVLIVAVAMLNCLCTFGSLFVESYYIIASVWMGYSYSAFGYLFLALLIAFSTSANFAVRCTYIQLRAEDYHWWWQSFLTSGAGAFGFVLYALFFYKTFEIEEGQISAFVLFFGWAVVASFCLFLALGFVGMSWTLWFNCFMYEMALKKSDLIHENHESTPNEESADSERPASRQVAPWLSSTMFASIPTTEDAHEMPLDVEESDLQLQESYPQPSTEDGLTASLLEKRGAEPANE